MEQRRIQAKAAAKAAAANPKPAPVPEQSGPDIAGMIESVIGCKWSIHVLDCVRRGLNRPGAMLRANEGLSNKVLSERLDKMVRFGILNKRSYPEVPPRVEYGFTPLGARLLAILDQVDTLKRDAAAGRI